MERKVVGLSGLRGNFGSGSSGLTEQKRSARPGEISGFRRNAEAILIRHLDGGVRFFRQLSQPFSADYAEALNNADAPGVLKGRQEGERRGLRFSQRRARTKVVTRGRKEREGGREVAGRAGDFARRVIVKLSSIYFTNLHITSAASWLPRKGGYRMGGRVGVATRNECPRRRTYVRKYMQEKVGGGGTAGGSLCVLLPSRKGLQETTDFVAPATSDVRRSGAANTDGDLWPDRAN